VNIEYHPAVEDDIAEALKRYDEVSPVLGDEFRRSCGISSHSRR